MPSHLYSLTASLLVHPSLSLIDSVWNPSGQVFVHNQSSKSRPRSKTNPCTHRCPRRQLNAFPSATVAAANIDAIATAVISVVVATIITTTTTAAIIPVVVHVHANEKGCQLYKKKK